MRKWMVLLTLSLSMFIIVIDTTVMNVSISALVVDLNTSVTGIQAAISLYALVMASFILIGGKLADVIGKKRTFVLGLAVFGVGTAMASVSTSLMMLIIGWSVIEGIGSALMMPNIQTILREAYEDKDRATAYGVISAVGAVGAAMGPIVGGFLTTYYSWRWAFRLEVAIVIVVLVCCRYISTDLRRGSRPKFDYVGAALSVCGWSTIVMAVLLGQSYGFWLAKQPFVIGSMELVPLGLSVVPFLFLIGVSLIVALFSWTAGRDESGDVALFRPSVFGTAGLKAGIAVRFIHMAVMAAFLFTMPLLLQLSFEFTAMETGLALIPFSLALLVSALGGARLSSRFSARLIIQTGFLLAIAGLVLIATTVSPDAQPSDMATGVVFGAGVGLIASQILNLVLSSVAPDQTAEVSGLNGTFEQLGNSIGVALVGTIMLGTLTTGLQDRVMAYPDLEAEAKVEITHALQNSVELVSSSQLAEAMQDAGADIEQTAAILKAYGNERTQSFKIGLWFLVFLSLLGLIVTRSLPNRKLV
ncbi:MFS transporter [Ruegeria atlantica]|uniref:Antiseptic resistance protein n=1 Tax=Ruegeria atlantica TaxID=81569 RepID=A0A0P1E6R1_9RHOB|nr:MFS transporter [Ruegeria atlantica]CUH44485.1 Antiseptic resistance protein [Ruegeria atlantica]